MFKLDTTKLFEATRKISAASGIAARDVLRNEVGVILKTCAGRTKVGNLQSADIQSRKVAAHRARRVVYEDAGSNVQRGQAWINTGLRGPSGRVWYRTAKNKFQPVYQPGFRRGWHIPPADWPKVSTLVGIYRTELPGYIQRGRGAVGLARQSWVQIADNLGIRLEDVKGGGTLSASGIAKARTAIASTGRSYANGQGEEFSAATKATIRIINNLPYGEAIGFGSLLSEVITGRVKFFERNVPFGMLESADKIARAYPGLRVFIN